MDDEDAERGGKAAALGALAARADARGSAYDADGGARAARAAAGGKEAGAWRCNACAGQRSASQRTAAAGADSELRCFWRVSQMRTALAAHFTRSLSRWLTRRT